MPPGHSACNGPTSSCPAGLCWTPGQRVGLCQCQCSPLSEPLTWRVPPMRGRRRVPPVRPPPAATAAAPAAPPLAEAARRLLGLCGKVAHVRIQAAARYKLKRGRETQILCFEAVLAAKTRSRVWDTTSGFQVHMAWQWQPCKLRLGRQSNNVPTTDVCVMKTF